MKTKITIMVDNTAGGRGTVGEHGFSAWIERGNEQILFDTGAGNALLTNTKSLKKSLPDIRFLVLSHGHWDHTGGLYQVLAEREQTKIIAHPRIFDERFSYRPQENDPTYRPAGIPFIQEELEQAGAHFHLTTEFYEFLNGLYFSGEIVRPEGWQSADSSLFIKPENNYVLDSVQDDISLLIETDSGPVIVFGCAHAGADTILDHFSTKSGYTSFYAVIGGTHLMRANESRIQAVLETFEKYHVQKIVTTHCTGFPAMAAFYQHFQERFYVSQVGRVFEF